MLPRMLQRTLLLAGAIAVPLAPVSCSKSKPAQPVAPSSEAAPPPAAAPAAASAEPKRAEPKRIQVRGSITAIDDLFAAAKDIGARLDPDRPIDPRADLQAMLLQSGFSPAFLDNIDLAGTHAFHVGYPSDQQANVQDATVSGSIAVVDARKLIDAMPGGLKPQPLGNGLWELRVDAIKALLKESGKELQFGLSQEDLALAGKLRAEVGEGKRVRVRVSDLPPDGIDPATLLDLPRGSKLAKQLANVARELESLAVELDLGNQRDAELVASAEAPFHRLGIEPLGAPRTSATAIEGRLPAGPAVVATLSFGDPKLVHDTIRSQVPVGEIPEPFGSIAKHAVDGAHALLDQVKNDVVAAVYLDAKGALTVVVAADVKDDAKTVEGLRLINQSIFDAGEAQRKLAGKDKSDAVTVVWKKGGLALGGVKADRLTIKPPASAKDDLARMKSLLAGGAFESVTFAKDGVAVVVIGAAAKKVAGDIAKGLAKPRGSSLAQDPGLARVRKSMGGCQVCLSGDPLQYFKLRLVLERDGTSDKDRAKEAKAALGRLAKLKSVGESSAGLRVERERAAFGLVVPASSVFAPADTVVALREINGVIEGIDAAPPVGPAPRKPGATPPTKPRRPGAERPGGKPEK
jgi:hypothetical protein